MRFIGAIVSIMLLSAISGVFAGETGETTEHSKVTVSGVVDFNMGEIMSGNYRALNSKEWIQYPNLTRNQWFGNPLTRLNLTIEPSVRLKVLIGFEGTIFLNTFPPEHKSKLGSNGNSQLMPPFMGMALHQAQGIFSLFDREAMSLDLSIGYLPYKYNPEVRNLGEFLFRSGTYPFFLVNDFNFPLQRLSGLLLNFNYGRDGGLKISVDQFLRMERTFAPLNDFSASTIVGFDWKKMVNAGFGVDFSRLIAVNGELTTPKGAFYPSAVDTVRDGNGAPVLDQGGYVTLVPRDTAGYYSFKGTKLMARATIDPLASLREESDILSDLLGKNGAKVYGEIAVIGTKNYPANPLYNGSKNRYQAETELDADFQYNPWGYNKIKERMPWMIGVNLPFWKILDLCALEIENYPAPYPNDYFQALYNNAYPVPSWSPFYRKDTMAVGIDPITGNDDTTYWKNPLDLDNYSGPRWYWSLYLLKRFGDHVSVYCQIARDHQRWEVNLGNELNYAPEEIMARSKDWAWRLGMLYEF
jgi:hypothetical protein